MDTSDDRADLPYTSQASLYEDTEAVSRDQADISTLKRIQKIADAAEKSATDIMSIDLKHPTLTAEQQILAYQFALQVLISPLKHAIDSAIDNVNQQNRREK